MVRIEIGVRLSALGWCGLKGSGGRRWLERERHVSGGVGRREKAFVQFWNLQRKESPVTHHLRTHSAASSATVHESGQVGTHAIQGIQRLTFGLSSLGTATSRQDHYKTHARVVQAFQASQATVAISPFHHRPEWLVRSSSARIPSLKIHPFPSPNL
ncbi:hypothetical protein R6Q59_009871 [Mikania micrantha]